MIGIRTDANSIIATGHMMRCITIAEALVMQGESVTFFVADEESKRLFDNVVHNEYSIVVLGTDYADMESELETLKGEIVARNISALLVDSYKATVSYFEKLKEICKIAYIDDLLADIYPVNLVINYSGYSKNMGYDTAYKSVSGYGDTATKVLLGLNYAPLRRQFYEDVDTTLSSDSKGECETAKSDEVRVLFSAGGADICNMLPELLGEVAVGIKASTDPLSAEKRIIWHVVVGDFVTDTTRIEEIAENSDNVILHRSVKNMAELMRSSTIAVLAAGTMLTESAACHVPTIFYQVADNQKYNVEYFGKIRGMIFAGDVSKSKEDKEKVINKICREVSRLTSDSSSLEIMKKNLESITDGKGAIRIAKALMEL